MRDPAHSGAVSPHGAPLIGGPGSDWFSIGFGQRRQCGSRGQDVEKEAPRETRRGAETKSSGRPITDHKSPPCSAPTRYLWPTCPSVCEELLYSPLCAPRNEEQKRSRFRCSWLILGTEFTSLKGSFTQNINNLASLTLFTKEFVRNDSGLGNMVKNNNKNLFLTLNWST